MGLRTLKRGENPRLVLGRHRERGRERFTYTRDDLEALFGVSRQTLYNWVSQDRLDPSSLDSICRLWHERAAKGDRP